MVVVPRAPAGARRKGTPQQRAHPVRPAPHPLRQPDQATAHFDDEFRAAVKDFKAHSALHGRTPVALDGTELFRSRTIHCPNCSTRKLGDSGTEHYHRMLSATATAAPDCARTRWKIENETFNVLKQHGYHLEHSFGHGG